MLTIGVVLQHVMHGEPPGKTIHKQCVNSNNSQDCTAARRISFLKCLASYKRAAPANPITSACPTTLKSLHPSSLSQQCLLKSHLQERADTPLCQGRQASLNSLHGGGGGGGGRIEEHCHKQLTAMQLLHLH